MSALLLPGLLLALALSSSAGAREAGGVVFPEKVVLGRRELVLNGTATRAVFGVRVYVAGLYVSVATGDETEIMDRNQDPKRVQIVMVRLVSKAKFSSALRDNIDRNFTALEQEKFSAELGGFFQCFEKGADLKVGSEVAIDYLPGEGTVVMVEGRKLALIPGRDFYHTLLRLWIGKPLQSSMKIGLLSRGESR